MAYSQDWLEDNNVRRCVLVVTTVYDIVQLTDVPIYLSTVGVLTQDSLVQFLPIIVGGMQFSESMSLDGTLSMTFGDIEISNAGGTYDTWLDNTKFIWSNKSIKIYYGDPSSVPSSIAAIGSSYQLIFDGLVEDIDSRSLDTLNIKVRDKLNRLNTPLTENKLGTYGTWASGQTNQDSIRPLVFGEVHNVEPLLIDPSILAYQFNDGEAEQLVEIRDNGVPVYTVGTLPGGASVNNTTGTYTLTAPLVGTSTCSVQGVKKSINLTSGASSATYVNNVANLIGMITTQYGSTYNRLNSADLDLPNLEAFETAHQQAVGLVVSDRENLLAVCQLLANSVGAQIYFTRLGKLQLLKIGSPTSDTPVTITSSDLVARSLSISNRTVVTASTKLGYAKNYTIQSGLVSGIPQMHKDMFAEEWLTTTVTDSVIRDAYKLHADPAQKDTQLIVAAEALAEATRLNNYFKVTHTTYSFTGSAKLLSLKLGQQVILKHNRFGLTNGVAGQVISLAPDWFRGLVNVEVLI